MPSDDTISYPRRPVRRALVRGLGRLILPMAFRIRISGRDNFPKSGPLIVVGNHRAAMEAVLMVVYTPWQVEMLGAADIPHERITQVAASVYGLIPIRRGRFDREPLVKALEVLDQGGVVAVFPEGGIWNAGRMRAHTGVAWLSYRANAPVLPIAFSGTMGALSEALKLSRPKLTMTVGQSMPAAHLPEGQSRKAYLQAYATRTVEAIKTLLPHDDPGRRPRIADERFELKVTVQGKRGRIRDFPEKPELKHAAALAEILHRPAILKIFTSNLGLPTEPLQHVERKPEPEEIVEATRSILDYLHTENPYLLTYRFGPNRAEAMHQGLEELLALARWASRSDLHFELTPIRRYTSLETGKEVVQIEQGSFDSWM